jgi:hypothetical protein
MVTPGHRYHDDDEMTNRLGARVHLGPHRSCTTIVSGIAERAAVGKGTLYRYFERKSDLLVACLDRRIANDSVIPRRVAAVAA